MRPQFSLRWLIVFSLWMGFALMLNFHVMKQRARLGADKVYIDFGRGWPMEFQEESSRRYALTPAGALTQHYDINSPLEVVLSKPNFSVIPFVLNLVVWIILFAILQFAVTKLLSLCEPTP